MSRVGILAFGGRKRERESVCVSVTSATRSLFAFYSRNGGRVSAGANKLGVST
jgi:hypothetical protein